jgi:hypothetical protein
LTDFKSYIELERIENADEYMMYIYEMDAVFLTFYSEKAKKAQEVKRTPKKNRK